MYRYYKISREWAERLGETEAAVRHPDGMYLVTPAIAPRLIATLHEDRGVNMLPEEAFTAIGAIGLSVAEAKASFRGELRHDTPPETDSVDVVDNAENPENIENPDNASPLTLDS